MDFGCLAVPDAQRTLELPIGEKLLPRALVGWKGKIRSQNENRPPNGERFFDIALIRSLRARALGLVAEAIKQLADAVSKLPGKHRSGSWAQLFRSRGGAG
jgi:hypothetical protein